MPWRAVFDAEYKNADGIVFNKIIFISWCALLRTGALPACTLLIVVARLACWLWGQLSNL